MQATQTVNKQIKNEGAKPVITLWKTTSKDGKTTYFTGYFYEGKVVGFYNTLKLNPNQPDLDIYHVNEEGKTDGKCASLWCKVSKAGNKYLSGSFVFGQSSPSANEKVFIKGFIQHNENPKYPYIKIYLDNDLNKNSKPAEVIKPIF